MVKRILQTEPAVFKGIVSALVMILLLWAPRLAGLGEQITDTSDIVFGTLMPLVAGFWIRGSVWSPASHEKAVENAVSEAEAESAG